MYNPLKLTLSNNGKNNLINVDTANSKMERLTLQPKETRAGAEFRSFLKNNKRYVKDSIN